MHGGWSRGTKHSVVKRTGHQRIQHMKRIQRMPKENIVNNTVWQFCMATNGNYTYCCDQFVRYIDTESLCCTSETSMSVIHQLKKEWFISCLLATCTCLKLNINSHPLHLAPAVLKPLSPRSCCLFILMSLQFPVWNFFLHSDLPTSLLAKSYLGFNLVHPSADLPKQSCVHFE